MPQSWLSPLAARRPAGAKGMGVFAVAPIPAETTVAAFGGRVVDKRELDRLDETIRVHALQIDEELYLAGELPFDDADYVNHSCEPNCGIVGSVLLVTMRDVAAGEELTVGYGETHHRGRLACRCGVPRCVGRL